MLNLIFHLCVFAAFLRKFNWLWNHRKMPKRYSLSDFDPEFDTKFRIRPDQDRQQGWGRVWGCLTDPPPLSYRCWGGTVFTRNYCTTQTHLFTASQEETETGEKVRLSAQCRTCHPDCVACLVSFPTCCSLNVIQMSLLNKKYSNPWKNHVFFCVGTVLVVVGTNVPDPVDP